MPEPENMKTDDFNSDRFVRNMLCDLNHYDEVTISRDWKHSEHSEDYYEWEVTIYTHNTKITKNGEHLVSVMWATLQEADVSYTEILKTQKAKREAALSKLSNEDKKVLGLA